MEIDKGKRDLSYTEFTGVDSIGHYLGFKFIVTPPTTNINAIAMRPSNVGSGAMGFFSPFFLYFFFLCQTIMNNRSNESSIPIVVKKKYVTSSDFAFYDVRLLSIPPQRAIRLLRVKK